MPRCKKNICIIFCLHGITIFETNLVKKSAYLSKMWAFFLSEIYNFKTEILFASCKEFDKHVQKDLDGVAKLRLKTLLKIKEAIWGPRACAEGPNIAQKSMSQKA